MVFRQMHAYQSSSTKADTLLFYDMSSHAIKTNLAPSNSSPMTKVMIGLCYDTSSHAIQHSLQLGPLPELICGNIRDFLGEVENLVLRGERGFHLVKLMTYKTFLFLDLVPADHRTREQLTILSAP